MQKAKFQKLILIIIMVVTMSADASNLVNEYILPNGLKLIVKQDHRAPVVTAQIWYKVGSSYEPKGLTGISHLLEHMMFRGTHKYGPNELKRIITSNGGEINAGTSYDYTMYYETVAEDKLPIVLAIEADRMQGLLLDKDAFTQELQVVIEERRLRTQDDPQAKTYEKFAAMAHTAEPYRHPIVGWQTDLEKLKVSDVKQWYQQWYAPNNAIIVIVGDVDPKTVHELVVKNFGELTTKTIPSFTPEYVKELPKNREVIVKAPAKLPWLAMSYNVPSLATAKDPSDAYTLEVIAAILDGGPSARIDSEIIREQRIAVDASASYSIYSHYDDLFFLEGTPAPGHTIVQLQAALEQQIKHLQQTLVTPEELAKIKAQVIAQKIYAKDDIDYQAQEIGSLEAVGLSWHTADEYVKNIEAVTPEKIKLIANKYLTSDQLLTGVLQPEKI
jgi:zinc protease